MTAIDTFIQYLSAAVSAHPTLAIAIAFLAAAAEAIVVIGAIVPGSVILVALGVLAGTGAMLLWPLVVAAAVGAVAGDLSAYALGRWLGERAQNTWPLATRPQLMDSGKRFFDRHGSLSVLFARFVPGIKTIVPAMAGILHMPVLRFVPASVASAIVWAPVVIMPSAAAGLGLTALRAVSTRLVVLILAFVAIMLVAILAFRLIMRGVVPPLTRWYRRLFARVKAAGAIPEAILRFADPERPNAVGLGLWEVVFVLAILGVTGVLQDLVANDPLAQIDLAMTGLMQSLRTAWADNVMVVISSLGDAVVVLAVAVLLAGYLIAARTPIVAAAFALAIAAAETSIALAHLILHTRPDGPPGASLYTFPSGHVAVAMTLFGLVASVLARAVGPKTGLVSLTVAVVMAASIALARIYLAAAWTTDAMLGLLFGLTIVAAFNLWFGGSAFRRAQPGRLALFACAAFIAVGTWHATTSYATVRPQYDASPKLVAIDVHEWRANAWQDQPQVRADFQGEAEGPLVLQWAGAPQALAVSLAAAGWTAPVPWTFASGLQYLSADPVLAVLPVFAVFHQGAPPALTLIRPGADAGHRWVLRLWQTSAAIDDGPLRLPLYLGSVTEQRIARTGWLTTTPEVDPTPGAIAGLDMALIAAGHEVTAQPRARAPDLLLARER